jgi:hypothetical protein
MRSVRSISFTVTGALVVVSLSMAMGQDSQRPRPGLTVEQTKDAIRVARGALEELRKKTEGAEQPAADRREYVIGVELLDLNGTSAGAAAKKRAPTGADVAKPSAPADPRGSPSPPPSPRGPRAVVISYRYFDDITVYSTVDLASGRVVDMEAAQHMRTPLSEEEFEDAQALAKEKSGPVKELYAQFGDRIRAEPQFSQFTLKGDPRLHRVVHLGYRVGKRELSYPRPQVNLTTRTVETPEPERESRPTAAPNRQPPTR